MTSKALRFLRTVLVVFTLIAASSSCSVFGPLFHGEAIDPTAIAPEINLQDQHGNLFQLSSLQGKVVLLTFGFTNCVYECPLTMPHIKTALEIIGEDAANIEVVLITTDPVRDTPQELRDFLAKFDPSYLGVSGGLEEMKRIWKRYGIEVLHGGETHSSFVYVVDRKGNLRLRIDAETEPEKMVSDLEIILDSE